MEWKIYIYFAGLWKWLKQTIDCQLGCCAVSGISLFTSILFYIYIYIYYIIFIVKYQQQLQQQQQQAAKPQQPNWKEIHTTLATKAIENEENYRDIRNET